MHIPRLLLLPRLPRHPHRTRTGVYNASIDHPAPADANVDKVLEGGAGSGTRPACLR